MAEYTGYLRLCRYCDAVWNELHGEESELCLCRIKLAKKELRLIDKSNPQHHMPKKRGKLRTIHKRYKGICFYCKEKTMFDVFDKNPTLDHYMPKSKGGSNKNENLVLSCRKCNSAKADLMPEEFLTTTILTP